MTAWKKGLIALFCVWSFAAFPQGTGKLAVKVTDEQRRPLIGATAELLIPKDSLLQKVQLTDSSGTALFTTIAAGAYLLRISHLGYDPAATAMFVLSSDDSLTLPPVLLKSSGSTLNAITISTHRSFIETKPGKTIVNMEASLSNAGATVLEALEKLPGITVDKDGSILLKGRSGVTVLIDGKQTFLDAAQLSNLLGGMNASQLSQVEIISQPASEFDAAGNAGIINLKTKKSRQTGFNGSVSTTFAQGVYPKNNNSLQLNFHSGALNWFLAYSINRSQNFTRIEALRTYYKPDGVTIAAMLEQPTYLRNDGFTQVLRTGLDYSLGKKTTAGLVLSGLSLWRKNYGSNKAQWLDAGGRTDSLLETDSRTRTDWTNGSIDVNIRHQFSAMHELSADAGLVGYRIGGDQFFENTGVLPGTYSETSRADLPSTIRIFSAKTDYTGQHRSWTLKAGAKTSRIKTDNVAAYTYLENGIWKDDLGKSNHFLYNETIGALYASAEARVKKWNLQGGLRYEATHYDAQQLGNAVVKDSSFSRSYNSLFPSALVSFTLDSLHTFSFSAGRRIDRPPFQKLNPFVFIINKYTLEQGNPYFRPQYTWNLELTHQYKSLLVTSLSYSLAKDYFSQIFPISSNGIVIYTEGNLRQLQTLGASVSVQAAPAAWWSLTAQGNVVHKRLEGFVEKEYKATVTQGSLTLNNQLRFKKGWGAELSGVYTSRSRNDIQEVVDPSGQVSLAFGKTLWAGKGNIRLMARDLFYTQQMKGLTHFLLSHEYFNLTRDTRMVTLSFSYRFGRVFKSLRRSQGAAGEEIERVGSGN